MVLPDVLRLKAAHPKCSITTSFLMRDPVPQYLSFYNYYIKKKQTEVPKPGDHGPEPPGTAAWGADAAEWASNVKDMQVRASQMAQTLGGPSTRPCG